MPPPISPAAGAIRLAAGTAAFTALLFVAAGTAAWPAACAYLVAITAVMIVYAIIIVRLHPELIDERRNPPADAKAGDKPFIVIVGVARPVALLVLAARTTLEDRALHAELDGYADYASRVRFRLVPGVW